MGAKMRNIGGKVVKKMIVFWWDSLCRSEYYLQHGNSQDWFSAGCQRTLTHFKGVFRVFKVTRGLVKLLSVVNEKWYAPATICSPVLLRGLLFCGLPNGAFCTYKFHKLRSQGTGWPIAAENWRIDDSSGLKLRGRARRNEINLRFIVLVNDTTEVTVQDNSYCGYVR